THPVEAGIVHKIDEHLRGARIRAGRGKCDVPLLVTLRNGIILNIGTLPRRGDRRIRADPKLGDETRHHPEDTSVVIEMMLDEVIEAVRTERRPGARDVKREFAARG